MAATSAPIARVESLEEVAGSTGRGAIAYLLIGAVAAATGLIAFGWEPASTIPGLAIGTLVFGGQRYFLVNARMIPRGDVEDAPVGIEVEPVSYDLSDVPAILLALASGVPLAALIDVAELGVGFLIGMPAGWAVADVVTFLRVRRWERANGRRVLVDPDAERGQLRPYAAAPF